jgi:hypothetical protein
MKKFLLLILSLVSSSLGAASSHPPQELEKKSILSRADILKMFGPKASDTLAQIKRNAALVEKSTARDAAAYQASLADELREKLRLEKHLKLKEMIKQRLADSAAASAERGVDVGLVLPVKSDYLKVSIGTDAQSILQQAIHDMVDFEGGLSEAATRTNNIFCPVCGPLLKGMPDDGKISHTSQKLKGERISLKQIKTLDDLMPFESHSDPRRRTIALTLQALGERYFTAGKQEKEKIKKDLEEIFKYNWRHHK